MLQDNQRLEMTTQKQFDTVFACQGVMAQLLTDFADIVRKLTEEPVKQARYALYEDFPSLAPTNNDEEQRYPDAASASASDNE